MDINICENILCHFLNVDAVRCVQWSRQKKKNVIRKNINPWHLKCPHIQMSKRLLLTLLPR